MGRVLGHGRESGNEITQAARPFFQQLRDVDPEGIVLHLHGLKELERLTGEVEAEPGEGLGVAVEELRRAAADDAVERRHALLAVEEQLDDTGGEWPVAAMGRRPRLGGPHEQPADGMAAIEGVEQTADLVAVPDVAALELREGHVAAVDVVEDGGEFHGQASLGWRGCFM